VAIDKFLVAALEGINRIQMPDPEKLRAAAATRAARSGAGAG
jgi:hypothetical protein